MPRTLTLCVCLLALAGCDLLKPQLPPSPPPVEEPQLPPQEKPVFSRALQGDSNHDFAVISLYRESFTEARLVLEAIRLLDAVDLDLMPPECLKVAGGSNTGSFQWKGVLVQPGVYEQQIQWTRFKPDCPPNGTLFYTVAAGSTGAVGSVPFDWPEFDVP